MNIPNLASRYHSRAAARSAGTESPPCASVSTRLNTCSIGDMLFLISPLFNGASEPVIPSGARDLLLLEVRWSAQEKQIPRCARVPRASLGMTTRRLIVTKKEESGASALHLAAASS